MLPNNFPPLVRPIKASRRHFCVQSEREAQSKKQKMADPTTFRKEDAANEKSKEKGPPRWWHSETGNGNGDNWTGDLHFHL